MSEKKDELIDLILNENVSAIQVLVDRLGITPDEVIDLINELLEEGKLKGGLTDDGVRFFKSEVKLSDAPTIERDDGPPSFMNFNTRPPLVIVVIGIIIIAGGLIVNAYAGDAAEQNLAAILIFCGLSIIMIGLYCLSQRKTPS
ncbi:MAG: hypothetical protein ACXACG_11680 [Candidatus Thorarchaeota archaeon]